MPNGRDDAPENASSYVDFNQYYDQNQDDEQRLMQAAMDRARGSDDKAQSALRRSQQEATAHYGPNGQLVGEQADITQTASYGDYLAAKKAAEEGYAGLSAPSKNPFSEAVRGAVRTRDGIAAQQQAALQGIQGRDMLATQRVATNAAGVVQDRTKQQAGRDAVEAEKQARLQSDAIGKSKFSQGIKDRLAKLWDTRDKRAQLTYGGDKGWQQMTQGELDQLDELKKQSRQDGSYDTFGAQGAWDTDVTYGNPGAGQDIQGYVGLSDQGPARYEGAGDNKFARKGGFKGWGP